MLEYDYWIQTNIFHPWKIIGKELLSIAGIEI